MQVVTKFMCFSTLINAIPCSENEIQAFVNNGMIFLHLLMQFLMVLTKFLPLSIYLLHFYNR